MPVPPILGYKKLLCLALSLVASFGGHSVAHGQPQGEVPVQQNPYLRLGQTAKVVDKALLLRDLKGNNQWKRVVALSLLSRDPNKLPDDEAVPLFTDLLRVDLPLLASPQELFDLDEFNGQLANKLADFNKKARPALPKLLALVNATDHSITSRYQALQALQSIAPHDPAVVKCNIELLKRGDLRYQNALVGQMIDVAKSGIDVSEAAPQFRRLLNNDDTQLATAAFYALGYIRQVELKPKVPDLKRIFQTLKHFEGSSVEQKAATLIGLTAYVQTVPEANRAMFKPVSILLLQLFQTENSIPVQAALLDSIGQIRIGYDVPAARLLLKAVADNKLRNPAADALFYGGAKSDADCIEFLIAALQPERHPQLFHATEQQILATDRVKLAVLRALTRLEQPASSAALPVAEVLRDAAKDQTIHFEVVKSCISLLSSARAAGSTSAPIVLELLQKKPEPTNPQLIDSAYNSPGFRASLMAIVSQFKLSDEKLQQTALDIAIAGLKQDQGAVYIQAAKLAGNSGSRAGEAIPYLLPKLKSDFRDLPLVHSYDGLSEADFFGMKRGMLESLIFNQMMKKKNPDSQLPVDKNDLFRRRSSPRLEAMRTIGKIGLPAAAPAIPLLEEWTKETAPPLYRLIAGDTLKVLKGEQVSKSTLN